MSTYEIRCPRAGEQQITPPAVVASGLAYTEAQRRMEELLILTDLTLYFQAEANG